MLSRLWLLSRVERGAFRFVVGPAPTQLPSFSGENIPPSISQSSKIAPTFVLGSSVLPVGVHRHIHKHRNSVARTAHVEKLRATQLANRTDRQHKQIREIPAEISLVLASLRFGEKVAAQ
jgi:hypothetical protein